MVNIKRQLQMACAVIMFSCGVIASLMAAQIPSPPPEIAAQAVYEDHDPANQVTFPNGVKGIPDLVYWEPIGYRPLTLGIYLAPAGIPRPAAGCPFLVLIHRVTAHARDG